jgi:undecaprenyl-diphosphatase
VTLFGSGYALFPLAAIFGFVLWPRGARWAGFYLIAALAGWGLSSALKALFARPRPTVTTHLDGAGWWSFPSGHTMESTIVLGLGLLLVTGGMASRPAARRIRLLGAVVLAAIGFSRVYLGVHYPSDVLAGWLAGGAYVAAALAAFSAGRAELHPPSPPGTS